MAGDRLPLLEAELLGEVLAVGAQPNQAHVLLHLLVGHAGSTEVSPGAGLVGVTGVAAPVERPA